MEVFIPGNTPSSKNIKIKTDKGIFHSKTVSKYLRSLGIQYYSPSKKLVKGYVRRPNFFKKAFENAGWIKPEGQVVIYFHIVRKTKRQFDFGNITQIIQDLMTAHDFIEDDSMDYLIPIPMKKNGRWFSHDKINP